VIEFEDVTLAYGGQPVLRDVTFAVPEGELVLVVGPTGSGKTSLLRCLHPSPAVAGGVAAGVATGPVEGSVLADEPAELTGRVLVDGVDLHAARADGGRPLVGVVRQEPGRALGAGTVESALAAAVRTRSDDPHAGQRQVEETLDLLGIADLRDRPVTELSGGQQQRVAIGVAVVAAPRVLVLDEPTSALDPVAAEDVLAILHRLVHDVGTTVVVAEHRLERVVHHADSVLLVDAGQVAGPVDPARAMAASRLRPPVVELGVRLGWEPLPLSVRDARRAARQLRTRLGGIAPVPSSSPDQALSRGAAPTLVDARRVSLVRDRVVALRAASLRVTAAEVVALMGRNGSGKSSLLATIDASLSPTSGRVAIDGTVARAPQDPRDLLADTTVSEQLSSHDTTHELAPGTTAALLARLAPDLPRDPGGPRHDATVDPRPADLSEGQRMCVALSMVLARGTQVVLLDEPTRGLDYAAKARLATILDERRAAGCAVLVATHDVELAAEVATRVVVLAEGEVVADGPAAQVLSDSPAFAPQVAKVMHPLHLLRVAEVLQAAASRPAR
jgi:energy-coupling factor transport system ATP-binding protein